MILSNSLLQRSTGKSGIRLASHADEIHQTDDAHPVWARVVPNQDPELAYNITVGHPG